MLDKEHGIHKVQEPVQPKLFGTLCIRWPMTFHLVAATKFFTLGIKNFPERVKFIIPVLRSELKAKTWSHTCPSLFPIHSLYLCLCLCLAFPLPASSGNPINIILWTQGRETDSAQSRPMLHATQDPLHYPAVLVSCCSTRSWSLGPALSR